MTSNTPRRYRKLPVEIEAVQWTGDNEREVRAFVDSGLPLDTPLSGSGFFTSQTETEIWVEANKSWLPIGEGEWILKDSAGFYPCLDEVFRKTYEPVEPTFNQHDSNPDGSISTVLLQLHTDAAPGDLS